MEEVRSPFEDVWGCILREVPREGVQDIVNIKAMLPASDLVKMVDRVESA